jgi:hypothetical protein
MINKHILGLGSLSTSVIDYLQANHLHGVSLEEEQRQHDEEIRLMKEQHQQELSTARQTYLLSTYTDVEQYFQELNENLINSSRDAERDMVDQRNQQFQTILIAATMMLTALLSILYQGQLPMNANTWFYNCYAICNTASLLFLLVSMFLGVITTSRVNHFMYRRSVENIKHLTDAMDQTKRIMKNIRGEACALTAEAAATSTRSRSGAPLRQSSSKRKEFVSLDDDVLETEWKNHEEEVYSYLKKRSKINEKMELLAVDLHNEYQVSFQHYWNKQCRSIANATLLLFYTGTCFLLMTTMIYMYGSLIENYHSHVAAIAAVTTIGSSLLLSLGLAIYLRYCDRSIELMKQQIREETEREDIIHQGDLKEALNRSKLT